MMQNSALETKLDGLIGTFVTMRQHYSIENDIISGAEYY